MSYLTDKEKKKEISRYPTDWRGNFGLEESTKGFRLPRDEESNVLAVGVVPFTSEPASQTVRNFMPIALTDPQPGTAVNSYARCFGTPSAAMADSSVGLIVNSREMLLSRAGSFPWNAKNSFFQSKTTSAINTAQTITLTHVETCGLGIGINIISVCSAGTATLTVEGSPDNGTTWYQIDSIAAAATIVKHYSAITVGAGTYAVSPLLFPYIKITAGTAGAGNTTTLVLVMK